MKGWKWLLLLLLSMFGMTILYGICSIPEEVENIYVAGGLSLAGCIIMCVVYAWISHRVENRYVYEMDIRPFFPDMAKGWLAGGGAMALSVLVMFMAGVYRISSFAYDWQGIMRELLLFALVAVGEEIICRAILLRMVEERWGTTIALVISSLIFGFMHYSNDGATAWSSIAIAITAVEAGSFLYSRTLWMPIGAHWAWNFIQGNVFGISVSGYKMEASLIHPSLSGPELLTGGAFGAEASLITVIIATAIAAWLIWQAYRKGNWVSFRCPWSRAENDLSEEQIENNSL